MGFGIVFLALCRRWLQKRIVLPRIQGRRFLRSGEYLWLLIDSLAP